jgi:hypothetical protein
MPAPAPAPPRSSLTALRAEHVASLQSTLDAQGRDDPRRLATLVELAEAQLALAAEHRTAAVALDPRAASLPAAPDRGSCTPSTASAETDELDQDLPQEPPPTTPPARDPAALTSLAPAARAHVLAADRAVMDATLNLQTATHLLPGSRERSRLRLRLVRALTELGQHCDARAAWLAILGDGPEPAVAVEGYFVFAADFKAEGRTEQERRALDAAARAADGSPDPALLSATCEKARALDATVSASVPACAAR